MNEPDTPVRRSDRPLETAGLEAFEFVWLRLGARPPAGFYPTGVASRWPDTGAPRAALWKRTA